MPRAVSHKINPKLAPFLVDVKQLHEDPRNARKHPDKNLRAIADSLNDAGQQVAIVVDGEGKIIKGNGTYRAATTLLGWKRIAAIEFDGDPRTARRFGVNDNRTGELAEWDFQELTGLLREETDLGGIFAGWDDHELEPLLKAVWNPPPSTGESFGLTDKPKDAPLFELSDAQEKVVLEAVQVAKEQSKDKLSSEDALVMICQAYIDGVE